MNQSPFGHAARLADALSRDGARIVLRQVTRTDGPNPLLNPPRVTSAVVKGDVAAGSTVIALRAAAAAGRLLPGDLILAAGVQLTVTAIAAAAPVMTPGFTAVAIAPAPVTIPDATPVLFAFAADTVTYGMINSFPIRVIDGERIMARDLSVKISAYLLPDEIPPDWSIIINGREMEIVSAVPTFMRDEIMSWTIQARL